MDVLQVNKFLYDKGGAETVMFRTAGLLRDNGHKVSLYGMQDPKNVPCEYSGYFPRGRYYGDGHGFAQRARDALASIYSLEARKAIRGLLEDHRPDIVHLHNIYHQLTLSVVDEIARQRIPMVLTLHDYKPVCPSYVLYTQQAPCHRCVAGNPSHAIVHSCIKGSRAASTIAATEALLVRTRQSYQKIDAFISPSRYLADVMVRGGLPSERIHVIPNFVADEQFCDSGTTRAKDKQMLLFVGRLEEVKGIRVLLAASRLMGSDVEVVVVGHGPMEAEVQMAARDGVVSYAGSLNWAAIARLMDEASALVVPSLWEENCPMVVLEAGARGCPVIASNRGGLVELIRHNQDGLLFPAGDAAALADAMQELGSDFTLSERLGQALYARVAEHNTSQAYLAALLSAYRAAGGGMLA